MNWMNLWNRLRGRPAGTDETIDEELAFHAAMRHRDFERQGLTSAEAALATRRSMGNLTRTREDAREAWSFVWLADLWRDVQYGARVLRAQPGFTAAATIALSLGIGLNGILFTVYNAMAFTPWAIRDAARAVQIYTEDTTGKWRGFSWPEYKYLRDHTRTLEAVAASDHAGLRVQLGDQMWNAYGIAASGNFFDALGTGFAAGRGFSPSAADAVSPAPEIVLQYDTWQGRFGGDAGIVGQWAEINGRQLQVVGVAAQGFSGPSGTVPHLWIPAAWRDKLNPGANFYTSVSSCCAQVLGYLRPGVGRDQAQAEINTLSGQFRRSENRAPGRQKLTDPSLLASPAMDRRVSQVFLLMSLSTGLILLLACANVANLQLARAQVRRREIAVRLSLGAARGRILRQLLAESILLASLAGTVTLFLTTTVPKAFVLWMVPSDEQIALHFDPDWRVGLFLVAASFATGLLFGLAPALAAVHDAAASGLRDGGRAATGGRLRALFLVAQVAVCSTVLGGAALLVRAMQEAHHIDPGFRWQPAIVVSPNLFSTGATDAQSAELVSLLVERLRQLPGVESVATTTIVPLGNTFNSTSVPRPNTNDSTMSYVSKVSPNYLRAMRIPMAAGRDFERADESRNDIVILNEALASQLLPGQNPIGKIVDAMGKRQVVGVVRATSVRELSPLPENHFYLPTRGERGTRIVLTHSGPAAPFLSELPKIARALDPRILASAIPFEQNIDRARRAAQIAATVAVGLSLLALTLACVGIYGVAAYHVAQRTREFGVRAALGARPGQIIAMVLKQNLRSVAIGSLTGIAGAYGLGQLLRSLLYGLSPADPAAVIGTISILAVASILAAWPNARRASSIEPATALRHE
ncbi:MAG: ABC transporter permease [Acidobacteria bacterium]|nr:ABC transporter permease [Acidobacteriota bacterium]